MGELLNREMSVKGAVAHFRKLSYLTKLRRRGNPVIPCTKGCRDCQGLCGSQK